MGCLKFYKPASSGFINGDFFKNNLLVIFFLGITYHLRRSRRERIGTERRTEKMGRRKINASRFEIRSERREGQGKIFLN